MTSSATVTGWEGAGVVSMVASMCRSFSRNMPGRARRRYPVLTSNPARCSVVPCPNLRSDSGERTRQAAGDMVPLGGSPERGAARPIVTPSHYRRSRHARPCVPEERLCRPEALARERAVHLHPGGSAAVPRGRGGRRGDRGARGGGAAPACEPAARGARAGGYARHGCLLSTARGLAQQDGRVLTEEVVRSFALTVVAAEAAARRLPLKRQCCARLRAGAEPRVYSRPSARVRWPG